MSQEQESMEQSEKRNRIPVEDFVSAWLDTHREGGNIGDVATKLGLAEGSVSVRASTLKKKLNEEFGVALPKLARRVSSRQKQDLTAIAAQLEQYAADAPADAPAEAPAEEQDEE
tara:strand:- start:334 stop:678 length:345 start_codon:yes stop_codon:yes gene_type:complete